MPELLTPPEPPPPPIVPYLSRPTLPAKPRVWPAYLLPVILMASQLALGLLLGVAILIYASSRGMSFPEAIDFLTRTLVNPAILLPMFAVTMLVNTLAIAIPLYFTRTPRLQRIALVKPQISWLVTFTFILGCLALSNLFTLLQTIIPIQSPALEGIATAVVESSRWQLVFLAIILALVAPILEELIFRGYIQTRLTQRHGPLLAILITSAFFGIFHFDLVQGAYAFLIGLYLGAIAHRAKSILPAILAHIAINTLSVLTLTLALDPEPYLIPLTIISLILLPPTIPLLRSKTDPAA